MIHRAMVKPFAASLIITGFALCPLTAGAQMPEGKAKLLVEGMCSSCHALQLIQNSSGYTREHWKELIGTMVDLSGNADQQNEITGYLAANFPSGPSSHPYGIAVLDGAVWYNESGMRPDVLVRFDIAAETFQSWTIKSGNVYAGILRNARITPQGTLLIHQTATNRVIEVIPQKR